MDHMKVLDFWFKGAALVDDNALSNNKVSSEIEDELMAMWFEGSEETDLIIKDQFQFYVSMAGEGTLLSWQETPQGMLANILLLDQFTRNIYRGLGAAFRYDEFALALCKKGMAVSQDQALPLIQRVFFYMPLQHAENLEDQEESLFRFSQLCEKAPLDQAGFYENMFRYARAHFDIIAQFGRFPYRNAALGRLSTKEEMDWLAKEGVRFGQ